MVLQELKEQAQHCLYQRFQNTAAALTQVKLETSLDTKVIELKKKLVLIIMTSITRRIILGNFPSRGQRGDGQEDQH